MSMDYKAMTCTTCKKYLDIKYMETYNTYANNRILDMEYALCPNPNHLAHKTHGWYQALSYYRNNYPEGHTMEWVEVLRRFYGI